MKEIKKISSGLFSRNLKLLKMAYGAGKGIVKNRAEGVKEQLGNVVGSQVDQLINEMGLMKGSIMKVGQMLSLYSDSFLPKELQDKLSKLENQSYFLRWDEIKKNIPLHFFDRLDIDHKPIAAASLGQVHKAVDRVTGDILAIKIQYKGVRKSIDNDILTLKLILKLSKVLPRDQDLTSVFDEVKRMLYQETDYDLERKHIELYREAIKGESNFYVPRVYAEFSTDSILTTEFIEGTPLRDVDVDKMPESLKVAFYELFFLETFKWGIIQTDAHPGNYIIQSTPEGIPYRWALIDFGAVKIVDETLRKRCHNFIKSAMDNDFDLFLTTLFDEGYLNEKKDFNHDLLKEYFEVVREPFDYDDFSWGDSDIPERIMKLAPKIMKEISVYKPQGDSVFIDRKVAGVYFISKLIKSKFNPKKVTERYVN
ncbi:MAG: putative unusual protein kinase regulating ubiquinone biosynthesis (AarF/ABC1/UbiB family) [Thermoproteota archaeon]|jgi:predicted unusual protein kinase regulating ubiquinone biosynthesis (AarF/ABC1/UbiB family)